VLSQRDKIHLSIENGTEARDCSKRRDSRVLHFSHLFMKTVVQNENTLLYFAGDEQWTASLSQAKHFHNAEEAMAFLRAHRLAACSVVQTYGTPFPEWAENRPYLKAS
jgi:hypothetical protein